jgi:co-chaperonin GroES (HSP10)
VQNKVSFPVVHDVGSGAATITAGPSDSEAPKTDDANIFRVGSLGFEAMSDRVIIQEDEFTSGYECAFCLGKGTLVCSGCNGDGKSRINPEARCSSCQGEGNLVCLECHGKGGLLVIPEISERRPASGKIVSCGNGCIMLSLGDAVLYSNFSGHAMDLERMSGQKVVLRILHEKEILCKITGHLELRMVRNRVEPGPG